MKHSNFLLMNQYKKLTIWQESVELAVEVYKITSNFPTEERFGLTSQTRRAGVSVASNIAEGAGRNNPGEFGHFLGIASGSAAELDTQFCIAERLEYITNEEYLKVEQRINKIQKMKTGLQRSLSKKK